MFNDLLLDLENFLWFSGTQEPFQQLCPFSENFLRTPKTTLRKPFRNSTDISLEITNVLETEGHFQELSVFF